MGRIVLLVMGLLWIAFGVLGLIAPVMILGAVGLDIGTADALADARAMYGGSQIGLGVFFVYCSRAEGLERAGLIALALVAAGFGLARSFGIAVDGARGGITFFALTTEVIAVALAWIALSRASATQPPVHA